MAARTAFTTALAGLAPDAPLPVAARMFAEAGVPVFPCAPGGKNPLTGHGFHDATADLRQVESWWRRFPAANIGMPTGAASGVVVVDVDVHGVNGYEAFRRARQTGLMHGWEALVRGPQGEGAGSILSRITEDNRYQFDQHCRIRAWQQHSVGLHLMVILSPDPFTRADVSASQ